MLSALVAAFTLSFCPTPAQIDCENRNYMWLVLAASQEEKPVSP